MEFFTFFLFFFLVTDQFLSVAQKPLEVILSCGVGTLSAVC